LETTIVFRLILYWNQTPISGSFYDWKMLAVDSWLGQPFQLSGPAIPLTTFRDFWEGCEGIVGDPESGHSGAEVNVVRKAASSGVPEKC
jgi:hypothetical protein